MPTKKISPEENKLETTNNSIVDNMKKPNPMVIIIVALIVIVLGVFGYEIVKNKMGDNKGGNIISNIVNKVGDTISNVSEKSEILEKMPKDFSQIAYMRFDQETIDLLNATKSEELTGEMKELLSSMKEFAAFEMEDQETMTPISFMIAKVDSNFDINKAINIGLVNTGDNYIHKDLGNNIIIYGTKSGVEYFENYKGENLSQVDRLKSQINDIKNKKYNFAVFTKPDLTAAQLGDTKYLENLQYGAMLINLGKQRTYGKLGVLFSGDLTFGQNYKFSSKLGNYLNEGNIFFTEVGNLLPIFELNKENFVKLIDSYAKQNPYISTLLTSNDYEKIANTFDGNIAISITEATNSYGIGLAVIFEKGDIFDVVNKLFPFAKEFAQAQAGTGTQMSFIEEENKIGIISTIPAPVGEMEAEISFLKKDGQALLQILGPNINNGGSTKLASSEKTVLNFFLDSGKLATLLKKYSALNPNLSMDEKTLEYYKDTKVYGDITLQKDEVLITFDTNQ